jgi:hypothetical protein
MNETLMDLGSLPLVFDRRRTKHPWLRAFQELERGEWTRRLICNNWRMDHRVSQSRETRLLDDAEFQDGLDGETWWQRRYEHFGRTICQPTVPGPLGSRSAYLDVPNGINAIARSALPAHEQLVHVASLNRILSRLTSGEYLTADLRMRFLDLTEQRLPERVVGGTFRDPTEFQERVNSIAEGVNRIGLKRVKEMVGLLCDALGERQPPWWAGFAQELIPLIEGRDWTGLAQMLGLAHLNTGEWLIVCRYEVRVLYMLGAEYQICRPTVVEAGDNPYHFPSPPKLPYGITMPLRLDERGACREVIHPPLRGEVAAEACSCLLCQIASPPLRAYNEIDILRRTHCRRLAQEYPQVETHAWLARHGNWP